MDEEAKIRAILKLIEDTDDKFMSSLQSPVRAFEANLVERLADFDRLPNGQLKNTAKNIKLVKKISGELGALILTPQYKAVLASYTGAFEQVARLNNAYFTALGADLPAKELLTSLVSTTIESVAGQLSTNGINTALTQPLSNMLKSYVSGQGRYKEMVSAVGDFIHSRGTTTLVNNKYPRNFLSSYADQVVTDALNQFNGEYVNTLSSTAPFVWYQYVGSNIDHTRSFCERMTKKRWIHVSELPEITAQNWAGKIPGTNAQTFFANRGGYRCRHGVYPVSDRRVPPEIRQQFD